MMIKDLGGKWRLRRATGGKAAPAARAKRGWTPAHVPGCVHLDLMAAGEIPDPHYGLNELDVQWVQDEDWLYSRTFDYGAELGQAERVDLVCEGLDTFATVTLNGREVGRADNMFCAWRWDVTGLLKKNDNELQLLFESAPRVGKAIEQRHGRAYGSMRSYVRKEQCAFGWDWGPTLNSCGIWRPLYLHGYSGGRIADVYAPVVWSNPARPVVRVQVEVEALREVDVALGAVLTGPDGFKRSAALQGRLSGGSHTLSAQIPVAKPRLWWPAGQGDQNLYALSVSGQIDGKPTRLHTRTLGLRRVELRHEPDEEGESFVICVNGRPIFCKGANWIPADTFLPRVTKGSYEDLLQKAVHANMNMLRVWGGGIYETDEFYGACDRLGVMVWQDFMFACAAYPDDMEELMSSVRTEAEQNVRRLRNHPSLVLWCGNNENQWGHEEWGWPKDQPWGEKIYHEMLPEICGRLDPDRPYWPGSPFGGSRANAPEAGDQHCWDVWHGRQPAEFYRSFKGRFLSEFGMQAPPALETIRQSIPSDSRYMQSRAMMHHNKSGGGTERLYGYLASYYRVPGGFEDTVYLMQIVQGEVIKTGVEYWRTRLYRTAGALFWQLNDCWPVSSWSCIDGAHRPKALYYYARRFFAPVLPVILYDGAALRIIVVNDGPERFEGVLACGISDLDGYDLWTADVTRRVPAGTAKELFSRRAKDLGLTEPTRQFAWCRLLTEGRLVGGNTWFFAPYMHVPLPSADWDVSVMRQGPCVYDVELESTAFAKGVWLSLDGMEAQFEDNFFDAFESVPYKVRVTTPADVEAKTVQRRLRIRTVADAR